MALTRGAKCKFPCPVCLVPREELHKGAVYARRTTQTMKEVYNRAKDMSKAEEEQLLKSFGLRGIEVSGMLTLPGTYSHLHY